MISRDPTVHGDAVRHILTLDRIVPGPPKPPRGVVDIGAAITQPMLDEYRDASVAKAAGKESPRLVAAYWACLLGVAALILILVVRGLVS